MRFSLSLVSIFIEAWYVLVVPVRAKSTLVPMFKRVMTRDRFMWLNATWHITDPQVEDDAKKKGDQLHWLWHLQPLLNTVQQASYEVYRMGMWVTVDEQRIGWNGRHTAVTYVPSKPIQWGFTIHMAACAVNYFIHSFRIYEGKKEGSTMSDLAERIVFGLLQALLQAGRVVVGDRWFTSLQLIQRLRDAGTGYMGTVRCNAAGFPKSLFLLGTKQSPHARGHQVSRQNGAVTATAWRDRKTVFLASSTPHPRARAHVQRWEPVSAPGVVKDYCEHMAGVDRADRLSHAYMPGSQTKRWWVALAWGIINIAVHNAYVIYCLQSIADGDKPVSNMKFRMLLALQLIDKYMQSKRATQAPAAAAGPGHRLKLAIDDKDCYLKRNHSSRKQTKYWCEPCQKHVCPTCYDDHLAEAI